MNEILVPLAAVDLIDRIALLTIAAENGGSSTMLQQRDMLRRTLDRVLPADDALCDLRAALYEAHADLATLQSDLQICEAHSDFGPGFVALTRSYLATLDQRDQIRASIAVHLNQMQTDRAAPV